MGIPAHVERNLVVERNVETSRDAWRQYALELEWEIEEMRRDAVHRRNEAIDREMLPRMEGQRIVRIK